MCGFRGFGGVVAQIGGVVVAVEHDAAAGEIEPVPEHDGAKSNRQRDQRRGYRDVGPWRGGRPVGGPVGPQRQPTPGQRRGEVGKRRDEMGAPQDIDQDRRGRAADAKHDGEAAQRIEVADQRTGHPDPRPEGEEQPGNQETEREREERQRRAQQRPGGRPKQRSGDQTDRSRRNPTSHCCAWYPAASQPARPGCRVGRQLYRCVLAASLRDAPPPCVYNTADRMSKIGFTLRYLAQTAAGVPRDLANTLIVTKLKPIRPTVLIYNCTWVCDANCEMCNNWKHGDRKSDMTLAQLEPAMAHPFWGAVENLNISGGEPTTRNDLPELVELFQRHLPRMRKIGINTTGLTPHRAIPMLRASSSSAPHDLLISARSRSTVSATSTIRCAT